MASIFLVFASIVTAFAHSGGTDSSGGHTNRKTGEYHYHNRKSAQPPSLNASTTLVVAPENRCSPYSRKDYPYSQSVEKKIVARQGMKSLYTGRTFGSLKESDIEHIVALSEAHDSGLCSASMEVRRMFASDLDNLTLAAPRLNRHAKGAKDAAEWLPPLKSSHCWFASQIVAVKMKYGLTADQKEYDALKIIFDACGKEIP